MIICIGGVGVRPFAKGNIGGGAFSWWLRRRTTVLLRWGGERLAVGHYTRVTQAVGRMNRKPGRKLRQMREKLLALENKM